MSVSLEQILSASEDALNKILLQNPRYRQLTRLPLIDKQLEVIKLYGNQIEINDQYYLKDWPRFERLFRLNRTQLLELIDQYHLLTCFSKPITDNKAAILRVILSHEISRIANHHRDSYGDSITSYSTITSDEMDPVIRSHLTGLIDEISRSNNLESINSQMSPDLVIHSLLSQHQKIQYLLNIIPLQQSPSDKDPWIISRNSTNLFLDHLLISRYVSSETYQMMMRRLSILGYQNNKISQETRLIIDSLKIIPLLMLILDTLAESRFAQTTEKLDSTFSGPILIGQTTTFRLGPFQLYINYFKAKEQQFSLTQHQSLFLQILPAPQSPEILGNQSIEMLLGFLSQQTADHSHSNENLSLYRITVIKFE